MKITVRHLVLATAWALSMTETSARAEVIHGCYLEKTGALRILVGANKQCSSNERPIDWNQEGPPGPAGLPGGQQPSSWAIAATAYVLPASRYVAVGDLASNNGGSGGTTSGAGDRTLSDRQTCISDSLASRTNQPGLTTWCSNAILTSRTV